MMSFVGWLASEVKAKVAMGMYEGAQQHLERCREIRAEESALMVRLSDKAGRLQATIDAVKAVLQSKAVVSRMPEAVDVVALIDREIKQG